MEAKIQTKLQTSSDRGLVSSGKRGGKPTSSRQILIYNFNIESEIIELKI